MKTADPKMRSGKKISKMLLALVAIPMFLCLVPNPAFSSSFEAPADNGQLSRQPADLEKTVSIRLVGVGSYEMTRVFQEVLDRLDRVTEVKPYRFNLNPDQPQACYAEWRVKIVGDDLFAIESALYHRLQKLAEADPGSFPALTRELTPTEIRALGFIEPQQAGSRFLSFVQTRRTAASKPFFRPFCDRGCCPVHFPADSFNHGFE